jgi:hypothetical protein
MWTKEAPKEPGFYWLRFVSVTGFHDDDTLTVVRLSRGSDDLLVIEFPGNSDGCYPTDATMRQYEWWSERICPPGGQIAFVGAIREIFEPLESVEEFNKAETQRRSGLRTIAKPGEPGYRPGANLPERDPRKDV